MVGLALFEKGLGVRVCSIDGCGDAAKKRGMCNKHYLRLWKHGDPQILKCAPNGSARDFIVGVVAAPWPEQCVTFPFKRRSDGYADAMIDGRRIRAHRLACELAHGPAPRGDMEATHSCGNGHLGCINPNHLRWASHAQNMVDKIGHGTSMRGETHPMSVLSDADVLRIRSLRGQLTQSTIAAEFGISNGHVSEIQTGKSRGWLV